MGRVIDHILDAVFPRYCLTCKREGAIVCTDCETAFHDVLSFERGEHYASFAYGNPLVRDLIKTWKYSYDLSAFGKLKELGAPTVETIKRFLADEAVEAVTYIPLGQRRFCERGFNQAEMIARWVGELADLPVRDLLKRREDAGHQAERSDEERKAAMQESPFSFKGGEEKVVLLVDDVWTTGATMEAAGRTLKDGGVDRVVFYTLAKGR